MTRVKRKTANVEYDGTALGSDMDSSNWRRGAVFEAQDAGFELAVRLPPEGSFTVGICHGDTPVSKIAKCGALPRGVGYGFFLYKHAEVTGIYVFDRNWKGAHTSAEVRDFPAGVLQSGNMLVMKYEALPERQLSLAINDGAFVPVSGQFGEPLADMPYLPFLNLGTTSSLEVRVLEPAVRRKRKRAAPDHLERLWSEREFTDAVIQTASGSIPVHRAILCGYAPLRAALTGGFQESRECCLRIDDVAHASVEAFVQFIYTGNLAEDANAAEVLRLAHRYDHQELVELCAGRAVGSVAPANVRGVVQALRLLKDEGDPCVATAWQRLSEKIASGAELREALMMSV